MPLREKDSSTLSKGLQKNKKEIKEVKGRWVTEKIYIKILLLNLYQLFRKRQKKKKKLSVEV